MLDSGSGLQGAGQRAQGIALDFRKVFWKKVFADDVHAARGEGAGFIENYASGPCYGFQMLACAKENTGGIRSLDSCDEGRGDGQVQCARAGHNEKSNSDDNGIGKSGDFIVIEERRNAGQKNKSYKIAPCHLGEFLASWRIIEAFGGHLLDLA